MKKIITLLLVNLLIALSLFPSTLAYSYEGNLIYDSNNLKELPLNFRKTTSIDGNANINLKGLDTLNISGSSQFSKDNLPLLKESIGNYPIKIIDLREESHGFINGIPVSFENEKNNLNKGLSTDKILEKEIKELNEIPLNIPLKLFNSENNIIPKTVINEATLTKENSLDYIRIPVTDGGIPTDERVNYFIDLVQNQKPNTWLHFHCKAGVGRTTLFMIMYDIMKNYNAVSLNDIINRQLTLGNIDKKFSESFLTGKRFEFLQSFYKRIKNSGSQSKATTFIFYIIT